MILYSIISLIMGVAYHSCMDLPTEYFDLVQSKENRSDYCQIAATKAVNDYEESLKKDIKEGE